MLIGLVGAPNKGKSTLFSALTMVEAQIADYAFTTIKPNLGMAYARKECAEVGLKVKCTPRNSGCINGTRQLPVNIIDVAGLVPGAHLGKGMGNQFLNDLISADALIQVVDVSGNTDSNGNKAPGSDPSVEVAMIRDEIAEWLAGIIFAHMSKLSKRTDGDTALAELLSGLKADTGQIRAAAARCNLTLSAIAWNKDATKRFAMALLELNKPLIVAANKLDQSDNARLEELKKKLPGIPVFGCSAAVELGLVKAAKKGVIDYSPGASDFNITGDIDENQKKALEYMRSYIKKNGGTGVGNLLNDILFRALGEIVVYPVEDEAHYTDHSGNVLPDAIVMPNGSTAYDLAAKIHTEIARGMRYAVDAKTKMRLQKEYVLKDGDVIKIVSIK